MKVMVPIDALRPLAAPVVPRELMLEERFKVVTLSGSGIERTGK
jgi:hypothetical protein